MVLIRAGRAVTLLGVAAAIILAGPSTISPTEPFVHQGGSYRMEAYPSGVRLATPDGRAVEFRHARVVSAARSFSATSDKPVRNSDGIIFDHGSWTEQYSTLSGGVQQMFLLREPIRSDAKVLIPVRSDLTAKRLSPELIGFEDAAGNPRLTYRDPVALDAAGHIEKLSMTIENNEIAIHIGGSYLKSATWPVLIDPIVGPGATLGSAGKLWQAPGMDIAWNPKQQLYFAVYHWGVAVGGHPAHALPNHHILTASSVSGRAIQVTNATGAVIPDLFGGSPTTEINFTSGAGAAYVRFSPSVTCNPTPGTEGQFMVVWAEGNWEVGVQSANLDIVTNDNGNDLMGTPIEEYLYAQEPYPPNCRIVGEIVQLTAAAPFDVAGRTGAFEVSAGDNANTLLGTTADPRNMNEPVAQTSCVLPDVSWDGTKYVVVWQTLEANLVGEFFEQIAAGSPYELRHHFWTISGTWYSLYNPAASPPAAAPSKVGATTWSSHLANQSRFFIKGPPSVTTNIVDGLLQQNLFGELGYDSVPTSPQPRVASLIHPGPDEIYGNADDLPLGSMIVGNVTTLIFNEPKSRVRARLLGSGLTSTLASPVFDVYSDEGNIVQRAYVSAGTTNNAAPDTSAATVTSLRAASNFLITFQRVEDLIYEGNILTNAIAVEFVGAIQCTLASATDGLPLSTPQSVALPDALQTHLTPTSSWCREVGLYLITWATTDTALYNPVINSIAYLPWAQTLFGTIEQVGNIASHYPVSAGATRGVVNGIDDTTTADIFDASTNHHTMIIAMESDFALTYYQRYKFLQPPPPPVGGGGGGGSGGEGQEGSNCGLLGAEVLLGLLVLKRVASSRRRR